MNNSYRYVLKTSLGEFYSEPTTTYREVRDIWIALSEAARFLQRVEVNDGSGWVTW